MFFFKKKKEEDEDLEIEEDLPVKKFSAKAGRQDLSVDRLRVKVEALDEIRKSYSERFAKLSEQIGELRSMIVDNEKEIQEINAKASRASDLVAEIKPEKLLETLRLEEAKVEALKAKIESNESVIDKVFAELKEIRSKIALFKGVDELLKLSREVKDDLTTIKKVEANIEKHANKFEGIYVQVQKRFGELDKAQSLLNDLNKKLSDFDKKVKEVKNIRNLEVANKLAEEQKRYDAKLNRISRNISFFEKSDFRNIEFESCASKRDFEKFKAEANNKINSRLKTQKIPEPPQKIKTDGLVSRNEFSALKEEVNKLAKNKGSESIKAENFVSKKDFDRFKEEIKGLKNQNGSEAFRSRLSELTSKSELESAKAEIRSEVLKELEGIKKANAKNAQDGKGGDLLNRCRKKIAETESTIKKGNTEESAKLYNELSQLYNELLKTDISLKEKNEVYSKIAELHSLLA